MVQNPPAVQEMQVRSLGQEDPLERKWQPTPVFLPEEFHGQRCLAGYSPWGCAELDMTQQLNKPHHHLCSQLLCSQQPGRGNSLNVHQ